MLEIGSISSDLWTILHWFFGCQKPMKPGRIRMDLFNFIVLLQLKNSINKDPSVFFPSVLPANSEFESGNSENKSASKI